MNKIKLPVSVSTICNPKDRFKEDAIRMIRAIRFSAQLNFNIEKETYDAIKECAYLIKHINQESINKEIVKILESDNPQHIELLYKTGIAKYIFPEIVDIFECIQENPNHWRKNRRTTVGEHTMDALKAAVENGKNNSVYNSLDVRMALLCHDFGKSKTKKKIFQKGFGEIDSFFGHHEVSAMMAEEFLKRLRFPNSFIKDVCDLTEYHDIDFVKIINKSIEPNIDSLREAYTYFREGRENSKLKADNMMKKLFAVRICDASGQNPEEVDNFTISSSEKAAQIAAVWDKINENYEILEVVNR